MRKRKNNKYLLLLILLLGITLGYALISTTLKINGTANVLKQTWNVYWDTPVVTEGSVSTTVPTRTNDEGDPANTKLVWTVDLALPGDYYEFTVDAVNAGTIDAMITGINNTVTPTLPEYIKYDVTYADGVAIDENHLLAKNTTEKYKVRVYYDEALATGDTINAIPTGGNSYTFTFNVTYGQATSEAIEKPSWFASASWDDIKSNYNNGNPTQLLQDAMNNGTTREVELDLDNDGEAETTGHLRIANLSTPSECSIEGFSQTACGLVLEFADIITTRKMNPYVSGDTTTNGTNNKGGWEYSEMRAYLNSTTYAYENTDYSTSGIYNALPSELRDKIIDTRVVSGYNANDTTNFTTTDKLYLLSPHEVWDDADENALDGINYYDKSYSNTRQLDYYKAKGVTTSNYSGAIKKNLSGANDDWWLRSVFYYSTDSFYDALNNGICGDDYSDNYMGVSPAFRLA